MADLKVKDQPMDMHRTEIENRFIDSCPQLPSRYHRPSSSECNPSFGAQQGNAVI